MDCESAEIHDWFVSADRDLSERGAKFKKVGGSSSVCGPVRVRVTTTNLSLLRLPSREAESK